MGCSYCSYPEDGILPNLSMSGMVTLLTPPRCRGTLSPELNPLLAPARRVAGVQLLHHRAPPAQPPSHILPSSHPRPGAMCLWAWLGSPGLAPLGSWQPSLSQQRLSVSFSCQLSSPPASRAAH